MGTRMADRTRDALALARCAMEADEQGARAVLAGVAAEGGTEEVARVLAWLLADLLAHLGYSPEWLAEHQRRTAALLWRSR